MIRLTHVPAQNGLRPNRSLVLLPGGPGLSSRTLAPLTSLNSQYDLYFVDLPGVDGLPFYPGVTFDELSEVIAEEVAQLSSEATLLGHSFGGFLAAKVALQSPSVSCLVCISVPFSKTTLTRSSENYSKGMSSDLRNAAAAWTDSPSLKTFNGWMAACGPLYFAQAEAGSRMLESDASGFELYRALRKNAEAMEPLLDELNTWSGRKLFLAGADDPLFVRPLLEMEAERANAQFRTVEGAKHFLHYDQPETVVRLIADFLSTEGR